MDIPFVWLTLQQCSDLCLLVLCLCDSCVSALLQDCVSLSTVPRKFDKASNSYKVSHHLIKTEGNDYRIDGITVSPVW